MKKNIKYILLSFVVTVFLLNTAYAQEQKKLAQTGMKFLNAVMDARASGMGDAVTAIEGNSSFLFLNPSLVANQTNVADVTIGYMTWIADIKYQYAAAAFAPWGGMYGVFGISAMNVNYGELIGTIRADNEQGFLETGTFSPYSFSFGVSYAKALSEKFQIGGTVKYVKQSLGSTYLSISGTNDLVKRDSEKDVFAFDFGLMYKTGYKRLNFGMVIRNFSQEIKYEKEQFQLPLTFKVGLSFNMVDLFEESINKDMHSLLITADAIHSRDYPEQLGFGFEYMFMNSVMLRAGYSFPNDEKEYSVGIGVKQSFSGYTLGVDYGYTPFGIFDPVHRLSVMFSL